MTEDEWLAATDPRPLIGFLNRKLDPRKGRLFAVACCRLVARQFGDHTAADAVDLAERYADGLVSESERGDAWGAVGMATNRWQLPRDASWWADSAAETSATGVYPDGTWHKMAAVASREVLQADPATLPAQLALFRCIVGNPFRPVAADSRWLTPTVVELADGIYHDRFFDRLPVLADALEEAGCEHPDVLGHCRGPGPHARGCWVVDLARAGGG